MATATILFYRRYYSNSFIAPEINKSDESDIQIEKEYFEILDQLNSCNATVSLTCAYELKKVIRTLKTKKSTGFDEISNFMVKRLP